MFPLDDERKKETQRSSGKKGESKSSATVVPSSEGTNSNGSPPSPPISNSTASPPRHKILQYAEVEEERFTTLARMRRQHRKHPKDKSSHPIVRKDWNSSSRTVIQEDNLHQQMHPSSEDIINDKHRKWRARHLKMVKEEAEQKFTETMSGESDGPKDSYLGTRSSDSPMGMLHQIISENCVGFGKAGSLGAHENEYYEEDFYSRSEDGSSYFSDESGGSTLTGDSDRYRNQTPGRDANGGGRSRSKNDDKVDDTDAKTEKKKKSQESSDQHTQTVKGQFKVGDVVGRDGNSDFLAGDSVEGNGADGLEAEPDKSDDIRAHFAKYPEGMPEEIITPQTCHPKKEMNPVLNTEFFFEVRVLTISGALLTFKRNTFIISLNLPDSFVVPLPYRKSLLKVFF